MKRSAKDPKRPVCPDTSSANLRAALRHAYPLPARDEAFTRRLVAEARRHRRPALLRVADGAARFLCSPIGYAIAFATGVFLLRDRLAPTLVGFWRGLISAHVLDPQGLAFYLCAIALVAMSARDLIREADR